MPAPRQAISDLVQMAYAAQVGGRLAEAAERYAEVLKRDPLQFDATHMLGVVQYHRGRFDDALRLLKRAVELQPSVGEARDNLDIVQTARRREAELCREVLPRLAPLVTRVDKLADLAATVSVMHLVIMQSLSAQDEAFVESILVASAATQVRRWKDPRASDDRNASAVELSAQSHPVGGILVFFGTEFSAIEWFDRARPELCLLVVTRDEPGLLLDRIRECSGEGRRQVGMLCCGEVLARRLPFAVEVLATLPTPATKDGQ
jgi:tetratricopeptide (TPR) repeat protein